MATCPSNNDRDHDLLKKIAENTCELAGGSGGTGTVTAVINTAGSAVSPTNPFYVAGAVTTLGQMYQSSNIVTRPNNATPYTALDVVGSDPAAYIDFSGLGPESYTAYGALVTITNVLLQIQIAAVPAGMASFRLHLYDSAPTAIIDNAAFTVLAADWDKYLGYIELPAPIDNGAMLHSGTEEMGYYVRKDVRLNTQGTLYGQLQTVGAFTPSALCVKSITLFSRAP